MTRNTFILHLFLVLAISGCTPNAVIYYRPAAEGGHVLAKHCVPVESLLDLEIKTNHSNIIIRAWADDGEYINQVYLGFSGGLWNNIKFTSTKFKVIDLDRNVVIEPLSIFADKDDGFTKLNTGLYAVPKKPLAKMPNFSVQIRLPEPMPENFDLSIPLIIIDGNEIVLPNIQFQRKVWVGISPFNC